MLPPTCLLQATGALDICNINKQARGDIAVMAGNDNIVMHGVEGQSLCGMHGTAPSLAMWQKTKLATATCCFCKSQLTACAGHTAQSQEPSQASGRWGTHPAGRSQLVLSAGAGSAAQSLEVLTRHQRVNPGGKSNMGVRQLLQAEHAEDASRRLQAGGKGACIPCFRPGPVTAAREEVPAVSVQSPTVETTEGQAFCVYACMQEGQGLVLHTSSTCNAGCPQNPTD